MDKQVTFFDGWWPSYSLPDDYQQSNGNTEFFAPIIEVADTLAATAGAAGALVLSVTEASDTCVSALVDSGNIASDAWRWFDEDVPIVVASEDYQQSDTDSRLASLFATEANDTVSAAVAGALAATLAVTEDADTASSQIAATLHQIFGEYTDEAYDLEELFIDDYATDDNTTIQGGATEQNDTLSAVAASTVRASLTGQEASDTCVSTLTTVLSAVATPIDQTDTLSAQAVLALVASGAATEGNDTLTAAVAVGSTASAAPLEANDTLFAQAAGGLGLSADASITEANDTLSSGPVVVIDANSTIAELGDALSADARGVVLATAGFIEANDLLSSAIGDNTSETRTVWVAPQNRMVWVAPSNRSIYVQ